jgi:hypothetical protein
MPMPEAAMNEDHLPATFEDEVGFSGKGLPVKAVTVAQGVDETANLQFYTCALSPHTAHPLASLVGG